MFITSPHVLPGICARADWIENSLYADTHRGTENVHTKAKLILNVFMFLPVLAQMTQYLSQQGDTIKHVHMCTVPTIP